MQAAPVMAFYTLGLRCARYARWPPQARARGGSGKASDTASLRCAYPLSPGGAMHSRLMRR